VIYQVRPGQAGDLAEYQVRRRYFAAAAAAQVAQHNAEGGEVPCTAHPGSAFCPASGLMHRADCLRTQ